MINQSKMSTVGEYKKKKTVGEYRKKVCGHFLSCFYFVLFLFCNVLVNLRLFSN